MIGWVQRQLMQARAGALWWRRAAYQEVFGANPGARSTSQQMVLADLARFCRARNTTFTPDAREHALLEGRRETWLRLIQHLHMSDEDIQALTEIEHGE